MTTHTPAEVPRPLDAIMLSVGDGHWLYVEEVGTRGAVPALFLHGGPGSGAQHIHRRLFDPERYHAVLFDQRGAGRSHPYLSTHANTTQHLVADIERIREHFGIARWLVFGGSWGSTLALAYAETHPERVSGMILRGIFLLRRRELEWFYQEGCSWIFPEAFEAYQRLIPPHERADMITAYHHRLTDPDRRLQIEAARAWSVWEGATLSLVPDPDRIRMFGAESYAVAFARIECHYFVNRGFFEEDGQLLANAGRLKDIPGVIVHGRYDVVTPFKSAWDLKRAWPRAELRVVPDAGHAMTEPGIIHELVSSTRLFSRAEWA